LIVQAEQKLDKCGPDVSFSDLSDEERALAARRWPQLLNDWQSLLFSELEKDKRLQ